MIDVPVDTVIVVVVVAVAVVGPVLVVATVAGKYYRIENKVWLIVVDFE